MSKRQGMSMEEYRVYLIVTIMTVIILRIIVIYYSSNHDNNKNNNDNNVKDALENFQDQGNYNIIVHWNYLWKWKCNSKNMIYSR